MNAQKSGVIACKPCERNSTPVPLDMEGPTIIAYVLKSLSQKEKDVPFKWKKMAKIASNNKPFWIQNKRCVCIYILICYSIIPQWRGPDLKHKK